MKDQLSIQVNTKLNLQQLLGPDLFKSATNSNTVSSKKAMKMAKQLQG